VPYVICRDGPHDGDILPVAAELLASGSRLHFDDPTDKSVYEVTDEIEDGLRVAVYRGDQED
jgi:hypothetical protein